jgi:hypothetical protein
MTVLKGERTWVNSNQRLHWAPRATHTSSWRHAAAVAAKDAQIPRIGRAWVVAELVFPKGRRRRDPANWYPTVKACVDGLIDAKVLPDDDADHLIGPDMRLGPPVDDPGQQAVRLGIYPVEGIRWPLLSQ